MTEGSTATRPPGAGDDVEVRTRERVYRLLTLVIQVVLLAGVVGFVLLHDWPNAVLTALVILLTLIPQLLERWFRVDVPPEFQLVAALFGR